MPGIAWKRSGGIVMEVRRAGSLQKMLLTEWKDLTNEGRDLKVEWNIMHMYSSAQLAKLIALKRDIDPELAAMTAVLHDIAVVETMKKEKHDEIAESYVRAAIEKFNHGPGTKLPHITEDEVEQMIKAIVRHSDKKDKSDDKLTELLKDVDCLDRYLHGIKTEGAYLERCEWVLNELGLGLV